jgi:hypothetical protein
MEHLLFTDLFSPRPDYWGLRGDPHLWDELSAYLAEVAMLNSASAVRQIIANAIETLTGAPLDKVDVVVIDRDPDDGMSSRHVSMRFWSETALPLLVSRFRGRPPETRDYFAELYVAGLFGDAGWAVYFPKRDVGFDFVVSKLAAGSMILRPVQVKGLYPTPEKRDKDTYGFAGVLSAVHPEMVVAMPFFSARERGVAPTCIAFMPLSAMRGRERGGVRCVPCSLSSGVPHPRPSFLPFMDQAGLKALENPGWSASAPVGIAS